VSRAPATRADPTTPNIGFTQPTVGLDRDVWGDLTNQNWSLADTRLGAHETALAALTNSVATLTTNIRNSIEPIGSMKIWPSTTPPYGWIACDGYALSRTDYAALFAQIGTTWGAGDGSTTFNLPNLQGVVPAHRGNWLGFGAVVGETAHTLSYNEMPVHNHIGVTDTVGDHTHSYTGPVNYSGVDPPGATTVPFPWDPAAQTGAAGAHSHVLTTTNAGSGWSHNIVQPTAGLLIVIKCLPTV
jgi:microcystin-dependent protein